MKYLRKYSLVLLIFIFPIWTKGLELDIYSNNALLYNLNDDTILYEKNSDEQVSIASLTKIMTAIVSLENIDNLDETIMLTYKDFIGLAEANASVAGFKVGEVVTYRDLLYGLLLPSGADAAQALTRNIAGSNKEFVAMMNQKAQELNLSNTHFMNPTGLDEEGGYSSVKDVATLLQYSLKNSDFSQIIKTRIYETSDKQLTFKSTITKTMENYHLTMDYLIGGKTGTTGDAGLCLASISEYNDVNYLLVTVKAPYSRISPYHFLDAKTIYEYFMNHYSYKEIVNEGDILVTIDTQYAKKDKVVFRADKEVRKYLDNSFNKEDLQYEYIGENLITVDMDKGEKLGVVNISYHDEILQTIDIILDEKQSLDIKKFLFANRLIIGIILIIILTSISIIIGIIHKVRKNIKRII